jgi:hypothetical protein
LEVALNLIGEVLIHTPPDPKGLWIHRAVAAALNDRDADDLRNGYSTGIYNSRGAYFVDPTGKPERELAEQFRSKAEEVEDAGFQRFAVSLKVWRTATTARLNATSLSTNRRSRNENLILTLKLISADCATRT